MQPRVNRRQWPRHEKQYLIRITVSLVSGASPATISNFSRGGLCFFYTDPLEKGAKVMIHLPQDLVGLSRDVRASVKWCVPAQTGGFAIGVQYDEPQRWTRYD
jgi:hypothetical protein